MSRVIALINYPGKYFKDFADTLIGQGFNVVWVCINHSDAYYLTKNTNVHSKLILDINRDFKPLPDHSDLDSLKEDLSLLESVEGPTIYDIIQMDRMLRRKSTSFAIQYIHHISTKMQAFFKRHKVSLISSGRDSALQLTSMLVGHYENIPWVVPTRLRIPLETYGFSTHHQFHSFVKLKEESYEKDREWAEGVLTKFIDVTEKPALKIAAQSFKDTLKLIIPHIFLFKDLLKRSIFDRGNSFSRYTIPSIIGMYLRRRLNMLKFKIYKPWSKPSTTPYCIYALHTQPESSIDVAGAYFSDQIGLIQFIARSLPVTHELYVKIHPTDIDGKDLKFYRRIKSIPGVRLIHDDLDSRTLIEQSDMIFTLTGTIGLEGGLLGKPVITFAKVYFNDLPTVHYCEAPPQLPKLIKDLLNLEKSSSGKEHDNIYQNAIKFYSSYRSYVMDGEVNRMFGANPRELTKTDLETIGIAYNLLFKKLVEHNMEANN